MYQKVDAGTERKSIRFIGIVQGVGFRYRAIKAAQAVGATGWVRNEYDGSVTMEIQGTEKQIDDVIEMIRQGRFISIDWMDIREIDPVDDEKGFRAVY